MSMPAIATVSRSAIHDDQPLIVLLRRRQIRKYNRCAVAKDGKPNISFFCHLRIPTTGTRN